jgi:hypothetical protein
MIQREKARVAVLCAHVRGSLRRQPRRACSGRPLCERPSPCWNDGTGNGSGDSRSLVAGATVTGRAAVFASQRRRHSGLGFGPL